MPKNLKCTKTSEIHKETDKQNLHGDGPVASGFESRFDLYDKRHHI